MEPRIQTKGNTKKIEELRLLKQIIEEARSFCSRRKCQDGEK